jgi:hypothetical protein
MLQSPTLVGSLQGKALLSVLWGAVPNYWAEGSAEVEGQKASIAVQTSLPYKQRLEFGVKWDLTSDNLLH